MVGLQLFSIIWDSFVNLDKGQVCCSFLSLVLFVWPFAHMLVLYGLQTFIVYESNFGLKT